MDKKMIPQKGEGRLFIVLPTLEIMLSSCDNSKMRAQGAGMEYSNFRKHCKMQTDLRIDTYTKCNVLELVDNFGFLISFFFDKFIC